MNILRRQNIFLTIGFFLFVSNFTQAQEKKFRLIQDNRFEELLEHKMSINNTFSVYKNYSVQIFYGERKEAEENYKRFKDLYPKTDATIIYSAPNYKVIVGNFKYRIQAEKFLKETKDAFPKSFVVRLKG
ncbi:SPOR domain-containing protein [Avrilella dinanensis]|uniref:SPOR domain-containing protein n=1 Tax=Avrilella dinanensis TaxID=2008672 RepID=A0A2M9R377_9FLAO|nr:SPOR domain-containing protein [Avrilella dinanensis]PJR03215.1 hypothetical protein CDL10_00900 [Avrilella dinanensis]